MLKGVQSSLFISHYRSLYVLSKNWSHSQYQVRQLSRDMIRTKSQLNPPQTKHNYSHVVVSKIKRHGILYENN